MAYRLPSGFTVKSTYRGLKKAWTGFRIAYREGNQEKMEYYVEGINKFEKSLGRPVSSFSDILMWEQLSNASAEHQNNRSEQNK
jgi:hypothetical protein